MGEVENRFATPTACGWRDITILVRVPLPKSGGHHIAELQLSHKVLWIARADLHKYWKTIRSMMPNVCHVKPEDMTRVQGLILDRLQSRCAGPSVHQILQYAQKNCIGGSAWVSPR